MIPELKTTDVEAKETMLLDGIDTSTLSKALDQMENDPDTKKIVSLYDLIPKTSIDTSDVYKNGPRVIH